MPRLSLAFLDEDLAELGFLIIDFSRLRTPSGNLRNPGKELNSKYELVVSALEGSDFPIMAVLTEAHGRKLPVNGMVIPRDSSKNFLRTRNTFGLTVSFGQLKKQNF